MAGSKKYSQPLEVQTMRLKIGKPLIITPPIQKPWKCCWNWNNLPL